MRIKQVCRSHPTVRGRSHGNSNSGYRRGWARRRGRTHGHPQPHIGKTYHLTGPQSENMHFYAREYSKALGRTISYQDIPVATWRDGLKPAWLASSPGESSRDDGRSASRRTIRPTVKGRAPPDRAIAAERTGVRQEECCKLRTLCIAILIAYGRRLHAQDDNPTSGRPMPDVGSRRYLGTAIYRLATSKRLRWLLSKVFLRGA